MRGCRLLLLPILLITIFAAGRNFTFAYDDKTTHPALTQEIIEFYNLRYPANPLTEEEKEWVISGSIQEDIPPRMINHFYDPVHNTGWTGANAGTVSPETMRRWSSIGAAIERPLSALEWVRDYNLQQSFVLWGGNRSWRRGMEYFADGDRKEFYLTLGHILHLLEDMGVPDHTRDDTHISVFGGIGGDSGSPYENYASRWTRDSIKQLNLIESLKDIGPPVFRSVEDYLKSLARYSNRYFFSKDTINDQKYQLPVVTSTDSKFGYGVDENNQTFPIVAIRSVWNSASKNYETVFELTDKDSKPILDAYFYRLSRQIILHGAGLIDFYLRGAEDFKFNEEFQCQAHPSKCVLFDKSGGFLSNILVFPNLSLVGFGGKLNEVAGGIKKFIAPVLSAGLNSLEDIVKIASSPVKQIFSQIGDYRDLFQNENVEIKFAEQAEMAAPAVLETISSPEESDGKEEESSVIPPALNVNDNLAEKRDDKSSVEDSPSVGELVRLRAQLDEAASKIKILQQQARAIYGWTSVVGGEYEEEEEEEELESDIAAAAGYNISSKQVGSSHGGSGSLSGGGGLGGSGSGGGGGGNLQLDTTAPAAISNLAISNVATSSATLSWTAPGDDDTSGTAALYIIRYATSNIANSNWSAAANLANPPAPLAAGASQSLVLTGLTPGTTYYFAIKTKDEAGNESGLSNIASATTELPLSDTSNVNHILISEVQVAGADAGDEFIELYNPTDWEVDISNWSIQYLSGAATSTAQAVKKNFESGSVIGARSYFLIARGLNASGTDGYTGSRRQDLSHRTFSLSAVASGATIFLARNQEIISGADDPDVVDRLAYGSGDGLVAESAAAPLPAAGQSLERKAWVSGACVSASGENEFSGNGCDTDNNANDFEIRSTPYPQNLANLPETRSAPQILNLSATYSSSTMNADFSWTLSADARGATSTNIYTISKLTSTSTVQLFRASSTVSFAAPMSEDTNFEFRVEDGEGFSRNTTTTVTSPFYSYRGAIFEQSLDTEALVAPPRGGAWFAQVFTPQRTGRVTSISFDLRSGIGNLDGANFCSLRLYQAASPLATSTANLIGSAYLLPWTSPPEESMSGPPCAANNFSFPTSTIYAGTTYTLVFSYSEFNRDFDIRGAGDVIPGSYWMGNILGPAFIEQASKDIKFSLSGIVMSDVLFTEPPSQPQNLQINFDRFNSELDLSWDAATDSDSGFHYQINYTTSTELSATGWRSVGASTTASIPLVYPNAYKVGVRARDDFYNVSASTVSEWRFPDDFSAVDSLVSQLDTNQGIIEGFGQGIGTTVEYGQTFTVATTSVPYSIRLNTEGTAGGSCWVKIYAAESIAAADFQNPVATTGILGGGGSNACDASPSKTFYFSSTGILNPGTNYIWIYTVQDGNGASNGIVGGYNPSGYPGIFSSRVTTSFIHYLAKPREYNAYFELFGDLQ